MTVRLAILGLGRGAVLTVPAFVAHPRIELIAGCDPSAAARDGFGKTSFASAEELFADGDSTPYTSLRPTNFMQVTPSWRPRPESMHWSRSRWR